MAHTLLLRRARAARRRRRTTHPKVRLVDEHGRGVTLPYAATDLSLTGVAPTWEELERPGRVPLLAQTGDQLQVLRGTFTVGYPDHQRSVERELAQLRRLAEDGVRVRWRSYGPSEGGWWAIDDYTQTAVARQHGSNRITRADVTLVLVEYPKVRVRLGPLTGGARSAPAQPAGQPKAAKPEPRTHTVVSGDTLWALAQRFYGDGARWKEIAAASGVRDPRKLQIGQRLTIP